MSLIVDLKGKNRMGSFSVYLGETSRGVGPEVVRCLDIEYINNWTYAQRGQGHFWALLDTLAHEARGLGFQALCVKEVINERLLDSLPRRGFTRLALTGKAAPTFLKRID